MRKNSTPSKPNAAGIFLPEVCCAQCGTRITVNQQTHTITFKIVGKNNKSVGTAILKLSMMLRITVEGHNCVFHVLADSAAVPVKTFSVRSALNDWKYLAVHGLVQVSRDTIINIAHVQTVMKDRIYVNHLDKGISVTKSYADSVSAALKFWFNLDYKFSS